MPVILKIEHKDGQRTAIWEIKEDEFALTEIASINETDFQIFSQITNPGRRLEWLTVRALLKEFYPSVPTIQYGPNGRPYITNHPDKISISHSGKMVGIVLHPTCNPGIDIEVIQPRIFKIADRFLGETEKEFLGSQTSAQQLTILWGAKEVMFKVYEHGGISFKEDFRIKPFAISTNGKLEGLIIKGNDIRSIPMEYMQMDNFMLVQTDYISGDCEKNSEL
jgi:4'-phosphopantetheinyl transferase